MNAPNATVRSRAGPSAGWAVSKRSEAAQRPGNRDLARQRTSYPLPDFLDDQRHLLELLGVDSPSSTAVDLAIDGSRLLSLCARELRGGFGGEFEGYFRSKYGPTGAVARRERFFQVLQFVDLHASEIERNGFGRVGSTMGIHAELLWHLLDFPVSPHTAMIPARALGKFYDDWGQHWF